MYGDLSRTVTQSEIVEAAKSANIHDFIDELPEVRGIILLNSSQFCSVEEILSRDETCQARSCQAT